SRARALIFRYRRRTAMRATHLLTVSAFLTFLFGAYPAFSEGNATRGQRVFGACAACHSLQPDQSMTGPSLAGLWNRKAGTGGANERISSVPIFRTTGRRPGCREIMCVPHKHLDTAPDAI